MGKGGFDIEVGGNTDLKGAVISSEADAEKNKISTETLTWSDLKNKAEWEIDKIGANISTKGDNAQEKNKGVSPIIGGKDGDADSITQSAISPGEIEVCSDPDQDLTGLSRDPNSANDPLNPIFDKDKILEKERAAEIFGEISSELISKYTNDKAKEAAERGDSEEYKKWTDGGDYKILLHSLAGGLMAEIGGGDFLSGAAGAGIKELVHRYLNDNEEYKNLDHGTRQLIAGLLGGMVTEVLTGNGKIGAESAINSEKNNHVILAPVVVPLARVFVVHGKEIIGATRTFLNGIEMILLYDREGAVIERMSLEEALSKSVVSRDSVGNYIIQSLPNFPNAEKEGLIQYDSEGYIEAVADELGNMIPYIPPVVYYGPNLLPVSRYDNKKADQVSQELSYINAHDFKKENIPPGEDKIGAHWDIAVVKGTNEIVLVRKVGGKVIQTGHKLLR